MKSSRFNFSRMAAFVAAALLVSSLVFTGCKTDDDDDPSSINTLLLTCTKLKADDPICKKWEDDYPGWNTYGTYDFNFGPDFVESGSYGRQEGTVYIRKVSSTEGYIYYQISDLSYFSYAEKPAKLGQWYGVYYSELSETSVKISDACPEDYTKSYHAFNSFESAVIGLTKKLFFGYGPVCTIVSE